MKGGGTVSPYFIITNLIVANYYDYAYRKIPNIFVIWVLTGGIGLRLLETGSISGLGGLLLALCVGFPLYLFGGIGAGDVKLFMALSILLSAKEVLQLGMYSLVIAVIYGLAYKLLWRKKGRTRIPMAPGMLLGAVILLNTGGV